FYADELAAPERALPHQLRLVEMRPDEIARRVRLCDLDLGCGARGLPVGARTDNLLALAEGAVDPTTAVALRVAAGRALAASADSAGASRGVALLREVAAHDPSGLGAASLERAAGSPEARVAIVAGELEAAVGEGAGERVRALRFRLARHRAATGALAEAMA